MTLRRLSALVLAGCVLAGYARAADPAPVAPPLGAAAAVAAPAVVAPATAVAAPASPSTAVRAAPGRPATTVRTPAYSPGPSAGSLLQTIFALTLVLGILFALAWVMKRYGPKMQAGSAGMRIVGALNLGGRERIMVVEVGDQWIVVGASPGRINALATMPKQEAAKGGTKEGTRDGTNTQASLNQPTPSASSFAEWLKQTIDKRNAN